PAHAESAGDQDRVGVGQQRLGALGLYRRAVDIVERHAAIVGDAAVDQRFVERLVALHLIDVFADDGDAHFRGGRLDGADDALPALQPRRAAPDVQQFRYPLVQSFLVQRQGQFIDGRYVARGEDRPRLDRAEERDLVLDLLPQRAVGAADE